MKNAKKIVMGGVAALALVTASVMGTMAYFTSKTETVTNTFTVGNVNITLQEHKTNDLGEFVDGNGTKTDKDSAATTDVSKVDGNSYKLLPGHVYEKDPFVTVSDTSEDCYLFITVKDDISAIEGAKDATATDSAVKKIADQIGDHHWAPVMKDGDQVIVDGAKLYVYANNEEKTVILKSNSVRTYQVFDNFMVDGSETDLSEYTTEKGKTITIKAYAVQADGFADKTPLEIWNAAF